MCLYVLPARIYKQRVVVVIKAAARRTLILETIACVITAG